VSMVSNLPIVARNNALKLECTRDFLDGETHRHAGDQWLLFGPLIHTPSVNSKIKETLSPLVLKKNQALKVEALRACTDCTGVDRSAGEQWLIRTPGFYIPQIDEQVV